VSPTRWLADEMVGRLARYLRVAGCDTVYARGLGDAEILEIARREDRVVVTRDRALAARVPRSVLLTSPHIADQWKALRAAHPEVPSEVSFVRCTECNGRLESYAPGSDATPSPGIPWDRVARGLPLFRCVECGHVYWEGTHTANLRAQLARWAEEVPK
jgi:uncharacterized protein